MLPQLLAALLLVASDPDQGEGWLKPDPSELTPVLGSRWKAQLAERAFLSGTPEQWSTPYVSLDQARVYVATAAGLLEGRSMRDGAVLWSRDDLGSLGASMVEHDHQLVIGSGSLLLFLDAGTGKEEARLDLAGGVGGRIVLAGSRAIVPIRPNTYVAVELAQRAIAWRAKRPTPEGITLRGEATPAIDRANGRVFLGFSDGTLGAFAVEDGRELWSAKLGKTGEGFADVDAEPQIVDGGRSVVAASYGGGLYKLDAASGRVLYHKEDLRRLTGLSPTGGSGLIVASHGDGLVLGIQPDSGQVRWRYKMANGWAVEPAFLGGTLVAVAGSEGPLAVLDVVTGKPVQLIATGSGSSAPPAFRHPDLGILSNKGLLLMLRLGSGTGITAQ